MSLTAILARRGLFWAVPLLSLLAACGSGSDDAPTGQVVASVAGTEITVSQLNAEINLMAGPADGEQLRETALQSLIEREILAHAADSEGVANLPTTAVNLERLRKAGLVDALVAKIRTSVPKVSDDEVQQLIDGQPASFAERRLLMVDQATAAITDPGLLKAMAPLETLAEIKQLLDDRGVKYSETVGVVDQLQLGPLQAQAISEMTVGEVFVIPEQNQIRINRIREIIPAPITGADALTVGRSKLEAERAGQLVSKRLTQIVQGGLAKVRYNPKFAPKPVAAARAGE